MNFNIILTDSFSNHVKQLAKKYLSIKEDYKNFFRICQKIFHQEYTFVKKNLKIKMNIASKIKGKSGGAGVITCLKIEDKRITLLDMYDQKKKDTLTDKEPIALLKKVE